MRIIDIVSSVSEFIDLSTGEFKNPFTFNYLLALKGVHNMKMYMNSITSKNTRSEQMKYDYYFAHAKNAKNNEDVKCDVTLRNTCNGVAYKQ